jgi:hypothetical protein
VYLISLEFLLNHLEGRTRRGYAAAAEFRRPGIHRCGEVLTAQQVSNIGISAIRVRSS